MNKKLRALLQRKDEQVKKARALSDGIEAKGEDFTDEEQAQFDAIYADIEKLNASIDREKTLISQERQIQGYEVLDDSAIEVGQDRSAMDKTRGFKSFGEFAKSVMNATANHHIDDRLIGAAAPSTYGNEGVGSDGGFLVPAQYSQEIWQLSLAEDSFLPLTDNMPINGNSMVFPSDETTPWGTDGVRAYWEGEASAATQTKMLVSPNEMRLKKLTALVPVSDELLQDASGLPSYLNKKVAESIRWKTNDAIVNGDGVGKLKGFASAGSLVVQAKETSQTAATINASNIVKMYSRLLRPGRGVWLVNPDAYPQLPLMTIGDQPVYVAPNGIQGASSGTLLGRPVILTDVCKTLGAQGDIDFVDFGMYRTLTKAGGIETATSMHLFFDASATAFRAVFRVDGQPILKSAVTPPNSSITRSGFVTLAVRS